MFDCAWATVDQFSRNDKHLQGRPGAVAVLHIHSRRLEYHPHVHLAMPAAALDKEHGRWRTKSRRGKEGNGYLFNHRALAKVFRSKVLAALGQKGLSLPAGVTAQWVVDCKDVGNGEKALVYLGRYLYRGVIRKQDILACDNGQIRFRYRDSQTGKTAVRSVTGAAPASGPATRVAQGLPAGAQLRLPASQQQDPDHAVAGGTEGDAQPDLGQAASAVYLPVLRGTDAGDTTAYLTGGGLPNAQYLCGRGRGRVTPGEIRRQRQGAPLGATVALGPKKAKNADLSGKPGECRIALSQRQWRPPGRSGRATSQTLDLGGTAKRYFQWIPRLSTGLVQQPVRIVARFAITIQPYSLDLCNLWCRRAAMRVVNFSEARSGLKRVIDQVVDDAD